MTETATRPHLALVRAFHAAVTADQPRTKAAVSKILGISRQAYAHALTEGATADRIANWLRIWNASQGTNLGVVLTLPEAFVAVGSR